MRLLMLGLVAGLAMMAGCSRTPPEQELRRAVADLEQAIESRDVSRLVDGLSEDFAGVEGMDRQQARRLAQGMFLRHPTISINTGPMTIQVQDQRASIEFVASVAGGSGAMLPDSMQMYRVKTGWRREGSQWLLVGAQWTPELSR